METTENIPVLLKSKSEKIVAKAPVATSCCTPKDSAAVCCTPSESKEDNGGACCAQPEDGSSCCNK